MSYPEPPLKEGQTYPGEITREEIARLEKSAKFCVSGLQYWPDDKPVLIYHDEVELLDDLDWSLIEKLQEREWMPESVFIANCCDDFVYSCFEIESLRMMLPGYIARMEQEDSASPANSVAGASAR